MKKATDGIEMRWSYESTFSIEVSIVKHAAVEVRLQRGEKDVIEGGERILGRGEQIMEAAP